MDKVRSFLAGKKYGFFVTVCLCALAVATAIIYAANYHTYISMMSWYAFSVLLVGAALSLSLTLTRPTAPWAPIPVALGAFVALLLYIDRMYGYVSVVVVGIDLSSFSPQFILCSIFIALTFVLGIVDIFMGQIKEKQEVIKQ